MIKDLIDLLGLQSEIEQDFKKMSEFPKTLFAISGISFIILILNTLTNFIRFNQILNNALYLLVGVVLMVAILLRLKVSYDFKHIRWQMSENFWNEYYKIYNKAIETGKIEDVEFDIENNKLSRKLDIRCVNQEISEEMIKEFMDLTLDSKDVEDIGLLKKYPMENWDFYQLYGLKMAYITNNKAVLFMKDKLPEAKDKTEEDIDIITTYLNAISTLTKQNQKLYKKDERKIIDVENKEVINTSINRQTIEDIARKEKEQSEEEIRQIFENDERFKNKDISEIMDVLSKMKNNKK